MTINANQLALDTTFFGTDGGSGRALTINGNSITATQIAADAIGSSELADNAVDTSALVDANVTNAKLATNAVTQVKMADASVGTAEIIDLNVTTGKLGANAVTPGKADLTQVWSFAADNLQISSVPNSSNDAANKAYVDSIAQGLHIKESVEVASTANVDTTSSPATIDGYTLVADDRILLKDQSTASQNGLWVFASTSAALTRASDMAAGSTFDSGDFVFVDQGSTNANLRFAIYDAPTPSVVGTASMEWTRISGADDISATAPIIKTGDVLSLALTASSSDGGGLHVDSGALGIELNSDNGLKIDGSGLSADIDTAKGLAVGAAGISAVAGTGITSDGSGISVKYGSTSTTAARGDIGISVNTNSTLSGGADGSAGGGLNTTLGVVYGSSALTAAQGNTVLSVTSGNGLSGGGAGTSGGGISTSLAVAVASNAGVQAPAAGVGLDFVCEVENVAAASHSFTSDPVGSAHPMSEFIVVSLNGVQQVRLEAGATLSEGTFKFNNDTTPTAMTLNAFESGDSCSAMYFSDAS